MYPQLAQAIARQHSSEMIAQARRARLAAAARDALRARRQARDHFVPPTIPDTVAELEDDTQSPATTR
jgi:hypothetical protein